MRSATALIASMFLSATWVLSGPAISAEKSTAKSNEMLIKRPKASGTTVMGDAPVALTSEECTQLGGSVGGFPDICLSGKGCVRRGEDGKQHTVCISKIK